VTPSPTTPATTAALATKAKTAQPLRLRWRPAWLLYVFVANLVVGALYSEAQSLLANPSSALDPAQLRTTFFWRLALVYPIY
jgi:hypothetical protein